MTSISNRRFGLTSLVVFFSLIASISGCRVNKFYQKNDYPFYRAGIAFPPASLLRTDGVYVLHEIWTATSGKRTISAKEKEVLKFYRTGQMNLVLDPGNDTRNREYATVFNNAITESTRNKSRTLFQGYFKTAGARVVTQQMNTPRGVFYYTYFTVEEDMLIKVSQTIKGRGAIEDSHYTEGYRAYYRFVPVADHFDEPNW